MRVADLTGPLLDLWVARADGMACAPSKKVAEGFVVRNGDGLFIGYIGGDYVPQYAPSSDWSQGGPVVDKYRIDLAYNDTGYCHAKVLDKQYYSTNALEAAMRALVHSVYGAEVPNESDQPTKA